MRYLLWLLVLAKCLTPPVVEVPLAVLPDRGPPAVAPIISTAPPQEGVRQTPVEEGLPPTPVSAARGPLHLTTRQWLAVGWLAGVAAFACIALTKAARTILWLRRERRTLPRTSGDSFEETFRSLRVKHPPRVWLIEGVGQPFVWGILRGAIYLPDRFTRIEDEEHRRDILAHEISHVLRFDAAVNILQIIAQAIFWFHPLLWWANQRIRREREKCCDEMAIAHLGAKPKDYSSAIVRTLIQAQESARPVPSLAVAGPVKNIEERIRAMLRPGKRFHTHPSLAVATTVVLIALVAVPTTVVLTARGQMQPATQSVDKPAQLPNKAATGSEKPEQPRYAARTFNSKMAFTVWYRDTPRWSTEWKQGGRTPSPIPLEIPTCWVWWVTPRDTVIDWDLLVREIEENKVPGLALLANTTATDSDWRRLTDCTGLKRLDLNDAATDAGLAYLKGMTELEDLGLSTGKITDAGLAYLKNLPSLRHLQLNRTGITDVGLVHLKGTALQQLDLGSTGITDAGLEHLKDITRLQQLDLTSTRITDAGLVHLKGLTALRELSVSRDQITDAGLEHLDGLTGLQLVNLADTRITDAGLAHLRGLAALQFLFLSGTRATDAGLEHLKYLTALQNLSLGGTQVTDAGLVHLKGLGALRALTLRGTQVTDAGLEQLKGLTGLEFLTLSGTQVTDTGLAYLKGLTKLQKLALSDTRITGAGLAYLNDMTRLRALHLCRTPITDASLAHLQGLTGLGTLNLYGTKITDAGLEHLQGLTGLGFLVLSGTQITDAGLENLKGLSVATILYLTDTPITDAGLEHLKGLTGLRILDLSGTQVTDTGVQQLKQSLPNLHVRRGEVKIEEWIKEG